MDVCVPSAPVGPGSLALRPGTVGQGPVEGLQASAHTGRVQVLQRIPSHWGGWIEQLRDGDPHFPQRNFHPRQVQRNPEVVKAFGSARPHSGDVLLQYAGDPPAGAPVRETPVLLVHGASKDGQFWWDPREDGSGGGLPQHLREQGYRVFALTFAHNQDDNFLWAAQIGNASERVRALTGASQVDLVAHSKGGLAARMYCSDFRQDWMPAFPRDVRRLALVAAPNGGLDYSFRHPSSNWALYGESDNPRLNAPMSWDGILAYGVFRDTHETGFGSQGPDYWPGQRQMLARWDGRYPLSGLEPDWYTSYHGGQGFVSRSAGIQTYIAQGGNLIAELGKRPVDPSVEVTVLAGNRADIAGIANETAGPSDGLLLLESAVALPDGTRVTGQEILPLNHKALVYDPRGLAAISRALGAEQPRELSTEQRQRGLARAEARFETAGPRVLGAAPQVLTA